MCKTKNLGGRELMGLDYQKLSVVLWGVVKKLQKRVEKLEKKKGRKGDSEDGAMELLGRLAREFNVRDPQKLFQIARREFPERRDLTSGPRRAQRRGAAEIIPELVQDETSIVVTADMRNKFRGLEAALPGGAVHRQKDPSNRNAAAGDSKFEEGIGGQGGSGGRRVGGCGTPEHVENSSTTTS